MQQILVASFRSLPGLLVTRGDQIRSVVSIGEPGDVLPPGLRTWSGQPNNQMLRLEFWDLSLGHLQHYGTNAFKDRPPASPGDIASLLTFERSARHPMIVHCAAGLSRSPACAFLMAAQRLGPGREDEAAAAVSRFDGGGFYPNTLIVRLGDEILNRDHALCRAWERRWNGGESIDWSLPTEPRDNPARSQ